MDAFVRSLGFLFNIDPELCWVKDENALICRLCLARVTTKVVDKSHFAYSDKRMVSGHP